MPFVKGQSGNPNGRPKKEREIKYHDILLSAVTFEQWERIIKRAAKDAERGDTAARNFLAGYLVGPLVQKHEVTGENGSPLTVKVVKGVTMDEL